MIKNPKKYKRKHSKLPKSVIEFVSTLKRRSLLGCDAINKLSNDIMQTVKKDLPSTPENIAAYNEFEEKRLKRTNFLGTLQPIREVYQICQYIMVIIYYYNQIQLHFYRITSV